MSVLPQCVARACAGRAEQISEKRCSRFSKTPGRARRCLRQVANRSCSRDWQRFWKRCGRSVTPSSSTPTGTSPNACGRWCRPGFSTTLQWTSKLSEKYPQTVSLPALDLSPVMESAAYLRSCGVPYEFRTTVVRGLHTARDMEEIADWLEGRAAIFTELCRFGRRHSAGVRCLYACGNA